MKYVDEEEVDGQELLELMILQRSTMYLYIDT